MQSCSRAEPVALKQLNRLCHPAQDPRPKASPSETWGCPPNPVTAGRPRSPLAHLVGLALPLAGALGVHPQVGVQLVGADAQVPHPARLQAQPGRRRQHGQEQRDAHGEPLPPTRAPAPGPAPASPTRSHRSPRPPAWLAAEGSG